MLIKRAATYREIYDAFRWKVPAQFNMAVACCDRWAADPDRVALIHEQPDGAVRRYSFAELQSLSNRCANMLVGLGLVRGDRVLLLLGQRPETAILHLGAWRAGLISVLCSVLFSADAVQYRMQTSGAKLIIADEANLAKAVEAAGEARVLCVDGAGDGAGDFWALLRKGADAFATVDTAADDPASSASRRAPPALPRARCTPIACCSDTCRAQKCSMISFPSAATCTGLQPTGPGSRG